MAEPRNRVLSTIELKRPLAVDQPGLVRTARLTLRPLRETDRDEYTRVLRESHDHLHACAGVFRPGESPTHACERHINQARDGDHTGTAWRRIGVTDDGRIIGAFNLATISRGLVLEADATWWIAAPECGKGFGREGVQALLDIAFAELPQGLGLHRVNAAIHRNNLASRRLATFLGFHNEPGETLSVQHDGHWIAHDLWIRTLA